MYINRKSLISSLKFLEPLFSQKTKIDVLKAVLLKFTVEELTLTATDLDTSITRTIPCAPTGKIEPASAAIPGKALLSVLRTLADSDIHLSVVSGEIPGLRVTGPSGAVATLNGVGAPEGFPSITSAGLHPCARIGAVELARLAREGGVAMGDGLSRFTIRGAQLTMKSGVMELAATDNHRLSTAFAACDVQKPGALLLPASTVEILQGIDDGGVEITAGPEHAEFHALGSVVTCKLLDRQFPDLGSILGRNYSTHASADHAELIQALKRSCAARAKKPCSIWTLDPDSGTLIISGDTAEGTVSSTVPIRGDGPGLVIGVQPVQILEYLGTWSSSTVELDFDGAECQFAVRGSASEMIAMPVRI